MSFDAGSITSTLGLNMDPFAQGMLRANAIASIFPQTVANFLANPLLGIIDLAKQATSAIIGIFRDTAAEGDNMGDLAASIGVGVDQLTAMGRVAALAGSSVEGVADGYRFLGRNIGEVMQSADSAAGKAFARIGVAAVDAQGKSRPLEDVMLDVADAISRLPEGAERTSIAMELLGRSGTALVPMLSAGSQAIREQMEQMRRYGAIVSQEAVATADAWEDSMGEMRFAFAGLKRAIGEPLIDSLLPYLTKVVAWTRTNQPIIREQIYSVFNAVGDAVSSIAPAIGWFNDNMRNIATVAGGAAAYIAGPAVVGAIVMIGPALLAVVNPINMVTAAVASLMIVVNPLAGITNLVRLGLAALVATAIAAPEKLGPLRNAFAIVADAGQRIYAVFQERVVPAVGNALSAAFAKLQPYLPTTAQVMDVLHDAVARVADLVETRVIPAVGSGLQSAFEWIGPRLPAIGAAFGGLFNLLMKFQQWVWGTAVPTVGTGFAAAWETLNAAVSAVTPYVQSTYNAIAAAVNWISTVAVPAIQDHFSNSWRTLGPVLESVGRWASMVWQDIFSPMIGWIMGTAVPAIGDYLVTAWQALSPIVAGFGKIMYGVYEIGLGVMSWATPAIDALTVVVRTAAGWISWWWKNVTEPFVSWVWATVKPIIIWIGEQIGWLLGKIGTAMSYLGKLINLTDEASTKANNLPAAQPGAAPTIPTPVIPTVPATPVVPSPIATPVIPADAATGLPTVPTPDLTGAIHGLDQTLKDLKSAAASPATVINQVAAATAAGAGASVAPSPTQDRTADAITKMREDTTALIERGNQQQDSLMRRMVGLLGEIKDKLQTPRPVRI